MFEKIKDDQTRIKFGLIYHGKELVEIGEFEKAKNFSKSLEKQIITIIH